MDGFHDVLFPLAIAFGSTGGPERRTDIVQLASGHEERNARWADSRRRYNAATGIRSLSDLDQVLQFFEARRGRLFGFRWRDRTDWQSAPPGTRPTVNDQNLGEGDGTRAVFPLRKAYGDASSAPLPAPYFREISKPITETVLVAVDGKPMRPGQDYALHPSTGHVTFHSNAVPAEGQSVTAGFGFDVPVRFDSDRLEIDLAAFEAGHIPAIPLVEVRV